ncbi:MAG: GNAT family N-acetyltransferase, partial [Candidatus Eremiobacteraeota bacterium]|nr:GNAT family N-acetyltransferase [Candidatus Eremiobacteraeota bacterium]
PACSWIASVEGTPAGCVGLRVLTPSSRELKHLFVDPAFRGKHIGRALLEAVHAYARSVGCEEIYLDSLPSMSAARRLYSEMGYAETERYYKDDVHRVFMRFVLS